MQYESPHHQNQREQIKSKENYKGTNNSTFWNISKDVEIQNLICKKTTMVIKPPAKRKQWKELWNISGSFIKRRKHKLQK